MDGTGCTGAHIARLWAVTCILALAALAGVVGFFLLTLGLRKGFVFRFFRHPPSMRFERADPSCVPVHARRPRDEPRPSCLLRGTSARQRQNSARSRMIGRGMPISHSSAPFPKPIVASIHVWKVNAAAPPRFLASPMESISAPLELAPKPRQRRLGAPELKSRRTYTDVGLAVVSVANRQSQD